MAAPTFTRPGPAGALFPAASFPRVLPLRAAESRPTGPVVLIPAYRPGAGLVELVDSLRAADRTLAVVVVDDGSGPGYSDVFDAARTLGAVVLWHQSNSGKGSALRTGFRHIRDRMPGRVVVCADADGQHRVGDILAVAARVRPAGRTMVLGTRQFGPDVPLRSRLGNALTSTLFRFVAGVPLTDTQTGLRGYPPELASWLLSVGGRRYEYELNLLLRAQSAGVQIDTVPIRTIYLDHNAGSHFRPVVDSMLIYWPLLKFSISSFAAFGLDTVALLALHTFTGSLVASVVGARVLSSTANYLINRRLVFENGRRLPAAVTAVRYFALAAVLLPANYAVLSLLVSFGSGLLLAKVITELTLFGVSFAVQRGLVFGAGGRFGHDAAPGGSDMERSGAVHSAQSPAARPRAS